jgi:hypothetical protein
MLEFVFVPDTDIEGYELVHAGHFGMFPSKNPGIQRATGTFNDTGSFELAVDFYPEPPFQRFECLVDDQDDTIFFSAS